jgi:hypothetical protein
VSDIDAFVPPEGARYRDRTGSWGPNEPEEGRARAGYDDPDRAGGIADLLSCVISSSTFDRVTIGVDIDARGHGADVQQKAPLCPSSKQSSLDWSRG